MFELGNPSENFEFYVNNSVFTLPNTEIKMDVIFYFLSKGIDIAKELGYYMGLRDKSIGYIITFLFFYKNLEYYDLCDNHRLFLKYKKDKNFILKYQNNREYLLNKINKNLENVHECVLLSAITTPSVFRNVTKFNFNPIFVNEDCKFDRSSLDNGINEYYETENLEEFDEILEIDPSIIYKFINSTKYCYILKLDVKNRLNISPYHYYYYFYKNYIKVINIFKNIRLSNCYSFIEYYNVNIENFKINEKKYCKDYFIYDFEYIEGRKYANKYKNLYINYNIYNYLCKYLSKNIYFFDNKFIFSKNDTYSLSRECNGNKNMNKLKNIIEKHLNSFPGDLFLYDFDNTLSVLRHELLRYINDDKLKPPFIKYQNSDFDVFPPFEIKKLSKASKKNKLIIFTMRDSTQLVEIERYLDYFDINAHIILVSDYTKLLKSQSKYNVLIHEWDNFSKYLGWSDDIKIKSLHFADDILDNFNRIDEFCENMNVELNLYLVNLSDEYFEKYIT